MRGSPLVYTELQRAGAKAASAVIILGKRGSNAHTTRLSKDSDIESSMADAEAIFTTMLVELKMDFSKIFTITELADEKNSKFLGVSFQIKHWTSTDTKADTDGRKNGFGWGDHGESTVVKFWDNILHTDAPQQESQQEIFGLPLYMSGRLLHPQLCENMLVQVRLCQRCTWSRAVPNSSFYQSIADVLQPVDPPHCSTVGRRSAMHRRHP